MNSDAVQVIELHTHSGDETRALGETIGACVCDGQVLALCGDLGAGKTTLVQGIAAGMGIRSRVTSPTFVLVNEYTDGYNRTLIHIDTYRLVEHATTADAATFGLADLLDRDAEDEAVVAVEWADRVPSLLPEDHLRIELAPTSEESTEARTIRLLARGTQSTELLSDVVRALAEHPPAR